MFNIKNNNFSHPEKRLLLIYIAILHSVILFTTAISYFYHIEVFFKLSLSFLAIFLLLDFIFIFMFSLLEICVEIQSILFLIFIPLINLSLGGFYNNTAVSLFALLVPIAVVVRNDIRKTQIKIKLIIYFLAVIIPFSVCFYTHDTLVHYKIVIENSRQEAPTDLLNIFNIAFFSIIVFTLLFYFSKKNNKLEEKITNMIFDILPLPIANKIIAGEHGNHFQTFKNTTILVADIVGFTDLCASAEPKKVLTFLDQFFSELDTITQELGLEKIKTVGDAYIISNGTYEQKDPSLVVEFGFRIFEKATHIYFSDETNIQLRIGIHTGIIFGGILGKKYFYDVWGDTINLANNIAGYSNPSQILVSSSTKELVADKFDFTQQTFTLDEKETILYSVANNKQS